MWLMKTLLTSGCTNQRGAGHASKEGEGDLSLEYWKEGHKRYFEREGTYSEEMELVFEEFELTEIL